MWRDRASHGSVRVVYFGVGGSSSPRGGRCSGVSPTTMHHELEAGPLQPFKWSRISVLAHSLLKSRGMNF